MQLVFVLQPDTWRYISPRLPHHIRPDGFWRIVLQCSSLFENEDTVASEIEQSSDNHLRQLIVPQIPRFDLEAVLQDGLVQIRQQKPEISVTMKEHDREPATIGPVANRLPCDAEIPCGLR